LKREKEPERTSHYSGPGPSRKIVDAAGRRATCLSPRPTSRSRQERSGPSVLDRLERALKLEGAERQKLIPVLEAQWACIDGLETDPRYQALLHRAEAGEIEWDEVERYQVEKCGEPDWVQDERTAAKSAVAARRL
jgi:hypothetical protein